MDRPEMKPPTLLVALAWAVVLTPLGWGVVQSVVKSLPLFQRGAMAPTATDVPRH